MSATNQQNAEAPLLQLEDVKVHFPVAGGWLGGRKIAKAVDGVSLTLKRGETLGVVGESGSGKSTLGRAILRHAPLAGGSVHFQGKDITHLSGEPLRLLRRHMQLVFQDPTTSLNPRHSVFDVLSEPLVVHGIIKDREQLQERVAALVDRVGLPADAIHRYPHAFSGGQRQRIAIARALAVSPELIVADEPVSALDVSVRAQVINLFQDLQQDLGLSYVLIAHDLAVVRHISHRIAIMYGGVIVEMGDRDDVYDRPMHPYTKNLLAAVPEPDRSRRYQRPAVLAGEPPSPISPPSGCRFHPRCPLATPKCSVETPTLEEKQPEHLVACWYAEVSSS